jgi:hypothetical protein
MTLPEPPRTFESDIRPVIERYCVRCHGEAKPKAGVNLARFKTGNSLRRNADLWQRVSDAVGERTMPPPSSKSAEPSDVEREKLVAAIEEILDASADGKDPGSSPIQRLTRQQYNNTIRDLLGVDTHPADDFPADGGGGAGFDNNASTLFVPPILMEKYLAAAADVLDKADAKLWRFAEPNDKVSADSAARVSLVEFSRRAFRRPVQPLEVDRFVTLFKRARERGLSYDAALKLACRAVLVSPNFLYLIESDQPAKEPYQVSDFELASRLSYFLWSSMPDDALYRLAARGTLHEPAVLEQETRRMLADPKARALAENFAGQWLRVGTLAQSVEPDRGVFPNYTPELRAAMIEEPIALFHAILREGASLLDLIDCRYSYVNEVLAKHYGIDGVTGPEFRRVELVDPNRGGVLGMAGVLTLTSYPRRTSPVLRGKWILEELLGTPPPPPPPDVKVLSPEDKPKDGKSFRQRLEQHREKPACAACHAKLDPLGFGLENFDGVGRWRTELGGEKLDTVGELTSGEKFDGPVELKKILIEKKKDAFVRNVTERMLSYALRRGVDFYDAPTIKQVIAALDANGYRGTVLVTEIVKSFPFQYRRNETSPEGSQ